MLLFVTIIWHWYTINVKIYMFFFNRWWCSWGGVHNVKVFLQSNARADESSNGKWLPLTMDTYSLINVMGLTASMVDGMFLWGFQLHVIFFLKIFCSWENDPHF